MICYGAANCRAEIFFVVSTSFDKAVLIPNPPALLQVKAPPANPEVELQRTKEVETHRHFARQGDAHTRKGKGGAASTNTQTLWNMMKYEIIFQPLRQCAQAQCIGHPHPHPHPVPLPLSLSADANEIATWQNIITTAPQSDVMFRSISSIKHTLHSMLESIHRIILQSSNHRITQSLSRNARH